jgi:pectinesterase
MPAVETGGAGPGGISGIGGSAMGGSAPTTPTMLAEGEPALEGSGTRPELVAGEEDAYTVLSYLAQAGDLVAGLSRDDWNPTAGAGDTASFEPDFVVAASGGTHTSVQAAIDAAEAMGGDRVYIEVLSGTYREVVCVPSGAPPITLYSTEADARATSIVFDNYSGKAKAAGQSANPCNPSLDSTTYGTSGSATFAAYADDFHAKNLTFSNDTNESAVSGAVQAVALMVQGDRAVFDNVAVLGNQDTLYSKTGSVSEVARSYFRDCYVEGDTDFIFGRGAMVLDGCTIHVLTNRNPDGVIVAPSTDSRNPYGILIANSTLTADGGASAGSIHLGRAWDESQGDVETYTQNVATGVYPNGQATYRDTEMGAHINAAAPWRAAATTGREYSSTDQGGVPKNRFYEFGNTGPGAP